MTNLNVGDSVTIKKPSQELLCQTNPMNPLLSYSVRSLNALQTLKY
jgi:hypothetical protein